MLLELYYYLCKMNEIVYYKRFWLMFDVLMYMYNRVLLNCLL